MSMASKKPFIQWQNKSGSTSSSFLSLVANSEVNTCPYSPSLGYIVAGYKDGSIKVWNPQTGQEIASLEGHSAR